VTVGGKARKNSRRLLRLDNRTDWSDADLEKFFSAGLRALGCGARTVYVRYGKGRAHGGRAWYQTTRLQITLPGPRYVERHQAINRIRVRRGLKPKPLLDYLELAQVFEHEIDHTYGLTHADMPDWWTLRPKWHQGLTIRWGRQ